MELAALCGDLDGDGAVTLAEYNTGITGGIDATGNIADFNKVRFRGVPFARSIYRSMINDFDEITWRVNLDFTPNEKDLYYFLRHHRLSRRRVQPGLLLVHPDL